MAIKTVTGSTGRPYVHVEIRLSQSATITATGVDAPPLTNATGDVTGAYSATLWANGDLTPSPTYYTVTEYLGTTDNTFTIIVPQTAGPFVMANIAAVAPAAALGGTNATINVAGDFAGRSFSAQATGPYTNKLPDGVTTTPAGVVTGKLWDNGGQTYNVKNFGVVGSGAVNESPNAQLAVNAVLASATGTGFVTWPPGTYRLDTNLTGTSGVVTHMGFGAIFTGAGAASVTVSLINWVPATGSLSFGTGNPGNIDFPLWSITPSPALRGRMGASYAENLYNGAVVDPTLALGYNLTAGGTAALAGEQALAWVVEGYYDDLSGAIKMEAYLHYLQSNGTTFNRPLFFQINRTTNAVVTVQVGTPLFQVLTGVGNQVGANVNILDVQANQTIFYAPQAQANVVSMKAATGQTAQLRLGYNAVDSVLTLAPASAQAGQLVMGGANNYWFYSNLNGGTAGGGFAVGVADNSAVGMFAVGTSAVGAKGLVARGRASQSGSLFEAQDENSVAHVYVAEGHSTKPMSFVVGKAVLANAATDGFLYLPTVAGTPSGVPTTRTGTAAHVYDTTAHKLWVYDAGWKGVVVA